ncbi:NUDIX hydrolase [Peribacillus alkalitolerans]|uniref:NUDIX hydrolase n=1 Tax=Peribacillus alkalitolerans TaxID=1550385 RepID=UPI0013D2785B|nr:NUDIX domain-containing protein [Peribacillus alkalitolerans]
MEIWDIYNINREKTGKTIVRGEKLEVGEYHLVVHIWIMNSRGEFLIQKRASTMQLRPNMWAMTGGSAVAGDDSHIACAREMYEEIGIQADMANAEVAFTVTRKDNICDVWLIKQDFEISECTMQVEEVSDLKWATIQEIKDMVKQKIFINYFYLNDLFRFIDSKDS